MREIRRPTTLKELQNYRWWQYSPKRWHCTTTWHPPRQKTKNSSSLQNTTSLPNKSAEVTTIAIPDETIYHILFCIGQSRLGQPQARQKLTESSISSQSSPGSWTTPRTTDHCKRIQALQAAFGFDNKPLLKIQNMNELYWEIPHTTIAMKGV